MSLANRLFLWLLLLSIPAANCAQTSVPAPAYAGDKKFQSAFNDAKQLERQRSPFAADAYKKANKIAGGKCQQCLQGEFRSYFAENSLKDSMAVVDALAAIASTPREKSTVAVNRAQVLLAMAGNKPKPEQLEAVHQAFQQAITLNPQNATAMFADGKILAQMGKLEDARADFKKCLDCISPTDPARLRAEHFAENPELSTHKMAPAFEVTALDGKRFNLDAMGGRVVLIDFWATWCGPCNEELPHMKKIAKEFAGQPLVIISVSWDSDADAWKKFINKNEMTWVQYRDADHKLSDLFAINAIPHYFTIDSDGVLTAEMLGEGSDVEGKLKKLIAKANEAKRSAAAHSGEGQ